MPLNLLLKATAARLRCGAGAVVMFIILTGWAQAVHAQTDIPRLPDLIRTLLPSVVSISSRSLLSRADNSSIQAGAQPNNGPTTAEPHPQTELGSGFVIDPNGTIVTNNHLIEGAFDVSVTFEDGTMAHADVIATSKVCDIALLTVSMNRKLPALHFGDSTKVQVGDPVVAIGNPLGWGGSVSTGIVSALNRDVMLSPFDDFIQTDAALNHGNSGGPLFNMQGEVIGINTALFSPNVDGGSVGIGFAIPARSASFAIDELRRFGVVRAGEIGLRAQDVSTDIALAAGLPNDDSPSTAPMGHIARGIIVTQVKPGGPAALAGVQEGDIVLSLNAAAIPDVRAFYRLVAEAPLDTPAAVTIWRQGQLLQLNPVVREWLTYEQSDRAALARSTAQHSMTMDLGLELQALTPQVKAEWHLSSEANGVLITRVRPYSVAADRGLAQGDVILKMLNHPLNSPQDLLTVVRGQFEQHRALVLLLVSNRAGLRWVPLPIDPAMMIDGKN